VAVDGADGAAFERTRRTLIGAVCRGSMEREVDMTEAEWQACADPNAMLEFLRGRTSDRKLWLFAVACLRSGPWDRLRPEWRACAEAEERYADGSATGAELAAAWRNRTQNRKDVDFDLDPTGQAWDEARETASDAATLAAYEGRRDWIPFAYRQARVAQGCLLRDIIGNPFQAMRLDPSWLAWNDGAVRKVAQVIYEGRTFDRLPLLADSLEEAGCADAAMLAHCHGGGEHVRGCWVVDLLLGKE
jgi:hypothetical protein